MRGSAPYISYKPSAGFLGLLFVLAVIAGLMPGCSPSGRDQSKPAVRPVAAGVVGGPGTGDSEAGRKIYNKYCHFCHGKTGMGDGPVGIAITPHPADFVHDTKRMKKTDEELFKSITEGVHRDIGGDEMRMPRWAEVLNEKERWDVLAYVRVLEQRGKEGEKKTPDSGR